MEQRDFVRAPFATRIVVSWDDVIQIATTVDISCGGMAFVARYCGSRGRVLRLKWPMADGFWVGADARVVRVRPLAGGRWMWSVAFLRLDRRMAERIAEFVAEAPERSGIIPLVHAASEATALGIAQRDFVAEDEAGSDAPPPSSMLGG
jgi:hypothetical protein